MRSRENSVKVADITRTGTTVFTLNHSSDALFLFTRYPQPGKTKTRLIPALGAVGAANLQRQMTECLFNYFQPACANQSIQLQVHFAGGSVEQMRDWLGKEVVLMAQCEGDLGDRLIFSLQQGFAANFQRIIVIGSDCPSINESHITQSLTLLNTHDVVLGPATDGGYYLIGLKQLWRPLFASVPWGTDRLMTTTQAIAVRHGLSVALLDQLSDIDRPEDLPLWHRTLQQNDGRRLSAGDSYRP